MSFHYYLPLKHKYKCLSPLGIFVLVLVMYDFWWWCYKGVMCIFLEGQENEFSGRCGLCHLVWEGVSPQKFYIVIITSDITFSD